MEKTKENLSNFEKFIKDTLLISCKLGNLWEESNVEIQQKVQNLLFPVGVIYNKDSNSYLTKVENVVLSFFAEISASYKSTETKKRTANLRFS